MRLTGKTAMIAGAGRNMGRHIALAFAREGAELALISRTAAELHNTAAECEPHGAKALAITADMTRHEDVNRAAQQVLATYGKIDIVVVALGMRPHKLPWEY